MSISSTHKAEILGGTLGGKEFTFKFKPTIEITNGKQGEAIMVVAANFHVATTGNKMMFFANAVRTILNGLSNGNEPDPSSAAADKTTIIYFQQGYNQAEIDAVKKSVAKYNVEFIPVSTFQEVIDYINNPKYYTVTEKENGAEKTKKYKREINLIHFYSHGKPSKIPFAYGLYGIDVWAKDETNIDGPQTLSIDDVEKIKPDNFSLHAAIYSFACRTANISYEEDFTPHYSLNYTETELRGTRGDAMEVDAPKTITFDTVAERYKYQTMHNSTLYKVSEITPAAAHPELSLAQKLADHLNIIVYAYISKTDYGGTFNTGTDKELKKGLIHIPDKLVEHGGFLNLRLDRDTGYAIWHPNGALNPVVGDTTTLKGLDYKMHAFYPKKQKEQINEDVYDNAMVR